VGGDRRGQDQQRATLEKVCLLGCGVTPASARCSTPPTVEAAPRVAMFGLAGIGLAVISGR